MGKRWLLIVGRLGLFLLAAAGMLACGQDGQEDFKQEDFENVEGPVGLFLHILRLENADSYTVGCLYSYDFTEDGYAPHEVVAGLPGLGDITWGVGTVGGGTFSEGTLYYITLHDAEDRQPTGAQDFERIDGSGRACFVPRP